MDMSAACTAPVQPTIPANATSDPLYSRYMNYRAALSRQLVTAMTFEAWTASVRKTENGHRVAYFMKQPNRWHPAVGWYVNTFAPNDPHHPKRSGPFPSKPEGCE